MNIFAFKVEIYVKPCSLVHNDCIKNGQLIRLGSFKLLVVLLLSVRYIVCEIYSQTGKYDKEPLSGGYPQF